MQITINKDFEKTYPKDFFKGLTFTQTIYGVIGLALNIGFGFFLWSFTELPIEAVIYASMPLMMIVIGFGFFKYQGELSLFALLKLMLQRESTKLILFTPKDYDPTKKDCFTMDREPLASTSRKVKRKVKK